MGYGPFDLSGGPFLVLYTVLFIAALALSWLLPGVLRTQGRYGAVSEPLRLSLLAGGLARFTEVVLAELYRRDAISIDRNTGIWIMGRPQDGQNSAETAVLGLTSPVRLEGVSRELRGHAALLEDRLVESGLMINRAAGLRLRLLQSLPLALLLAFGWIKWDLGTMREKPVGYLTILLILTVVALFKRFRRLDRCTVQGRAAIEDARLRYTRLSRAVTREEAGLAVALFGTAALAGSSLAGLHLLRKHTSIGTSADGSGG